MGCAQSSEVKPITNTELRQIPGDDKSKFVHLIKLILNGHGYFKRRMELFNSTVFRINIGVKGIAICDRKGIQVLFDLDKIYKEPKFGRLNYNLCLLENMTPSIFTNGAQHELQKAFLIKVCQIAQKADLLKAAKTIVPQYLERWHNADAKVKKEWETEVMTLTSAIFSEGFLGQRVEPSCMHDMMYASWTRNKEELMRGKSAAQKLVACFKESPNLKDIIELSKEMRLSEEQAIRDILFMLNFNGYGAVSGALRSAIARLQNLDPKMKQQLEQHIIDSLGTDGITHESLKKMKLLDNFVLEVFRMSPTVPLVFGRAKSDFTLQTSTGSFEVKSNELLVGNIYLVQRDATVFSNPDKFLPSRFEDENLLHHLVFSNGPYEEQATPSNHHCPGKEIIFTVVKVVLIHILLCCEISFTTIPYWTDKKLRRLGCPDNMMELKEFVYNPRYDLIKQVDIELQDIS